MQLSAPRSIQCILFIVLSAGAPAHAQFLLQTTGAGQLRPNLGALSPEVRPQMSAVNAQAQAIEDGSDPTPTGSVDCPKKPERNSVQPAANLAVDAVNVLGPALDLTGKCPRASSGGDLAEDLAIDMRNRMGLSPKIRIRKSDGKFATTEDWVAVDLLARTLYGEIGGKTACATDEYFAAVGRVIMNRAEFMKDPDHEKHTNFFKDDTSVKNPYAKAAISPHEFQVWHEASRYVMCPASEIQKSYKDKSGTVIASTGAFDYVRWFGALQAASDMIFDEHAFRCKTENVKSLFYTKGSLAPGKNFSHVRGVTVGQQKIDNEVCVQLWDSPNAPFRPTPTAGCRL